MKREVEEKGEPLRNQEPGIMSDDESDTSCGEEQVVSDFEIRKEWLENILKEYHDGKAVSRVDGLKEIFTSMPI